ncbi:MAG: hydrogenase maturation nickel metallochaperone HypA [Gemmatimonadaceae bacterium]
MHELSIATSIVDVAMETVDRLNASRVSAVNLRIGRLAGVDADALRFSFDVVTQGTRLEGAALAIAELPVVAFCDRCDRDVELPAANFMHCPLCDQVTGIIRQGKELEIASLEIDE